MVLTLEESLSKIFYIKRQKEPGKPKEEFSDIGKMHDFQLELKVINRKLIHCINNIFPRVKSKKCLKSYNNDVKYGYAQRELTNDEVEYLKLFEEEIEARLKYRNQMRRWEMDVNGRPLGPRRERPE
ncbi:hypothetical protein Tco_0659224 [Tanacetum coccineum]